MSLGKRQWTSTPENEYTVRRLLFACSKRELKFNLHCYTSNSTIKLNAGIYIIGLTTGFRQTMTLWPFRFLRRRSFLLFGRRRIYLQRRFRLGVILIGLPCIIYLTLFVPSNRLPSKTSSVVNCQSCATKHTAAVITHASNKFTSEVRVEHQESTLMLRRTEMANPISPLSPEPSENQVHQERDQSSSSSFSLSGAAGYLNVHMWSGICGTTVDTLRMWPPFPYLPDKRSSISRFQKTQDPATTNNGERIFGFIHPQSSGVYKFAITSDDTSELWLSLNEDPASSEMIARVYSTTESAWTEKGDFKKYPEQISKEITLQTNKKYYIETLSKQGSGAAHVAVYWSYNSSTFEIISSKYLSSFSESKNRESFPPHAGKQDYISIQNKDNFFYFHRLPLLDKKLYSNYIPTCPYSPSFLVRRKLQRQEAAWNWMAKESHVYPQDDTNMIRSSFRPNWTKPNPLVDENRVEFVVDKFITMSFLRLR